MTIKVDLREMKDLLVALNRKIDLLIEGKETLAPMSLAERPLKDFFEKDPEIYSIKDFKVRYI